MPEVKYPGAAYRMPDPSSPQGNAFAIISGVCKELRAAGAPDRDLEQFRREAMSSDYEHLLATARKWVHVI